MKVVEKGTIKSSWSELVICTGKGNGGCGCGANLEVHLEDVYSTTSYSYDGSSGSYLTVMCPVCSIETDIKGPKCSIPEKKTWMSKKMSQSEP